MAVVIPFDEETEAIPNANDGGWFGCLYLDEGSALCSARFAGLPCFRGTLGSRERGASRLQLGIRAVFSGQCLRA